MDTLQMFHPIIFSSEVLGVPFASNDWAEKLLLAVDCSLVAFEITRVAEIADFAIWDGAFVRAFVLVHVSPVPIFEGTPLIHQLNLPERRILPESTLFHTL